MNQPTATTESQTTEASTTASSGATPSEQQTTEDKDTSLNEKPYQMFKRQLQMNYLTV